MLVNKLYLQDFRRFTTATYDFTPGITIFLANNGSGKTTVLEALALLSTGKSFRAEKTLQMIRFDQEIARAYALVDDQVKLGITLTPGLVAGKKTSPKLYTLGNAKKRQKDFIGQLLTVCFRPEDLRLIEGSPSRRRDYLDQPLSLISDVYRAALKNYQATLIRRNKLLQAIRDGEANLDTLTYYDNNLLTYGQLIHQHRQKYLNFLNHDFLSPLPFEIIYDHSTVTPERLAHYQRAEIASGHTLIGPHKDDFDLLYDFGASEKKSLLAYGSRGQHRLAVLWLKLAELAFLTQQTTQQPVLLLDDILSELDPDAQATVIALASQQQTIITTTDRHLLPLFPTATLIEL